MRSWGWVLVVPSARLEAYSALARGPPSNLLLFWFGKFCALFLIIFPPSAKIQTRDIRSRSTSMNRMD
jgi:hypothetical protein